MKTPFSEGYRFGRWMAKQPPRVFAALVLGLAVSLLALYATVLLLVERSIIMLGTLGITIGFLGRWGLVTGRMVDTPDAPMWWRTGKGVVTALGVVVGLYLTLWYPENLLALMRR